MKDWSKRFEASETEGSVLLNRSKENERDHDRGEQIISKLPGILILILVAFMMWPSDSSKTETAATAETAAKLPNVPEIGQEYRLKDSTLGADTLSTRTQLLKSAQAKDAEGAVELGLRGKACWLEVGAKVRVLDIDISFTEGHWARVRSLKDRAVTCWIPFASIEGIQP